MKIVKKDSGGKKTITIRINEHVMKQIDELSEEHDISRQRLIEAILEQALKDKSFVLTIS
ncbi:MAG: ribbon-helix-helix protein, CopG family [Bdellovibrionota bacterium]